MKRTWITRLVCLAGLLAAAAQPTWGGQANSPGTHLNLNIHKLTVVSPRGTPSPSGMHYYIHGSTISATISSPILVSGALWYCYGWRATGGVPVASDSPQAAFPIQQDTTLTWRWSPADIKNAAEDWLKYQ